MGKRLITTLWVGSLWTVGYLVAPGLFAWLDDRQLAGELAGRFFAVEVWLSLAAAALWFALTLLERRRTRAVARGPVLLVVAMVVLLAIMHFILGPQMESARALDDGRFALLHGLSSVAYLGASVLGLALVFSDRERAE